MHRVSGAARRVFGEGGENGSFRSVGARTTQHSNACWPSLLRAVHSLEILLGTCDRVDDDCAPVTTHKPDKNMDTRATETRRRQQPRHLLPLHDMSSSSKNACAQVVPRGLGEERTI